MSGKVESVFKCPSHGIIKTGDHLAFFNAKLVSVFDEYHHEIKINKRFDAKLDPDEYLDRVIYAEIKDADGNEVDRVLGLLRESGKSTYGSYTFTSETGYVKFVKIIYHDTSEDDVDIYLKKLLEKDS